MVIPSFLGDNSLAREKKPSFPMEQHIKTQKTDNSTHKPSDRKNLHFLWKKTHNCPSNSVTGDKNLIFSHNLNLLRYLEKGVLISLRYQKGLFVIKLTRVKEHHLKIGGFYA